jgi:hypothetical protein
MDEFGNTITALKLLRDDIDKLKNDESVGIRS